MLANQKLGEDGQDCDRQDSTVMHFCFGLPDNSIAITMSSVTPGP